MVSGSLEERGEAKAWLYTSLVLLLIGSWETPILNNVLETMIL